MPGRGRDLYQLVAHPLNPVPIKAAGNAGAYLLADMIRWRDRVTPALGAVAAVCFLFALFFRPHSLPTGSAVYAPVAPPRMGAKADRAATAGVSYAIDSIEEATVQYPITGAILHPTGPIIVHGWAVNPATLSPASALYLSIDDGRPETVNSYRIPRPDVGNAINPTATDSGFAATIDAQNLRPGPHTASLILEYGNGKHELLPTPVRFTVR